MFEGEKFIEIHILHSESFKENIRQNKKFCQHNIEKDKSSTIQ